VEMIKDFVTRYLSGDISYPDALDSLDPLVGYGQAREILRYAVEEGYEEYATQLAPVHA